jgi:hypothetical protein
MTAALLMPERLRSGTSLMGNMVAVSLMVDVVKKWNFLLFLVHT